MTLISRASHSAGGGFVPLLPGDSLATLMQDFPYQPSQLYVSASQINSMAKNMQKPGWNWSLHPVRIDASGRPILTDGHHTSIASMLSGVQYPAGHVQPDRFSVLPQQQRLTWANVIVGK